MKSKYLSRRAFGLHIALVVWVTICLAAAWWQVGAALLGNSLSYLYAVEWPAFAVLGANDIDHFTALDCQGPTVKALIDRAPDLHVRAVASLKLSSCMLF